MKLTNPVGQVDGFTLVLPAVSIANIGQLAVDILLSSFSGDASTTTTTSVGGLLHNAVIPCVASDPFDLASDDLMTACQVFKNEAKKLLVLQLRSAIAKSKEDLFLTNLLDWCLEIGIRRVVVLSSISSAEMVDSQIAGSPLRFLTTEDKTAFSDLGWVELERKSEFPALAPGEELRTGDDLPLTGAGFTKAIYLKSQESNFPLTVLMTFASEGDNRGDAVRLVDYYNEWAQLFPQGQAKFPKSWSNLFGNPAPGLIY